MRRLFSKKSQATLQRYCAGMLAVLLSVAYALPSMAVCPCCESMNVQPTQEVAEVATPSCHSMIPVGDEKTEEISSKTEEIATKTEEISSCHESDVTVPVRPETPVLISNGCGADCMTDTQSPAVASPGMVQAHNSMNKVHPTVALSDMLFSHSHLQPSVSPVPIQASAFCPIHASNASVPLCI